MKYKQLNVSLEYKAPELTVTTLEAEAGLVLCASTDFELLPELDSDKDF